MARLRKRALALAGACFGLLIMVYFLAVRTVPGQRFEDAVLAAATLDARGAASTADGWALRMLSTVSTFSLAFAIILVVVIGQLRGAPGLGLLAAGVVVASVLSGQLVRAVVERPLLLDFGIRRFDQSFPSGHTIVALSVMCALALVTPYRLRPLVVTVASTWAASVTVATVAVGWHRPSDTTGSSLIVLFWVWVAVAVLAARTPDGPTPDPAVRRNYRRAFLAVPGLEAAAAAVTMGGFRFETIAFDSLTLGCAIALGASVVVALTVLLVPPGTDAVPSATVPAAESEKSC